MSKESIEMDQKGGDLQEREDAYSGKIDIRLNSKHTSTHSCRG